MIEGDGIRIRRANPGDVEFLVALETHVDVKPFLAAIRASDPDSIRAEVERSIAESQAYGRFVVEVLEDGEWRLAGAMGFEVQNRRSRIANVSGVAIHPDFRGRGLADAAARLLQRHLIFDLDYHRVQLEIYGFNERALRHAERAGYVREGVRRKAYWRRDEWVDGVLYGLVREDFES